jgi:hypothetical protein
MSHFALSHLADDVLLRRLADLVRQDRLTTAQLLAHLAEVEVRHLHLRAGYDSMKAYCVGELRFSDEAARMRVYAAHVARNHPALFDAVADGKLTLTAVTLLASHLNPANVDELIEAATHKTRSEIELELARRFPMAEALRLDDGVSPQVVVPQEPDAVGRGLNRVQLPPAAPARIAPITVERYTLQVTIDAETHEKLRRVQSLLGHAVPSGDVARVLDRALEMALAQLERKKFARVAQPRRPRESRSTRGIPSHVRRAVWQRDGGRCAFIGENGHRCGSTTRLEFDHIVPVALGGKSTIANLRLVCRVHNEFAAEQAFSPELMAAQRQKSELREDVAAGLRSLGMKATDARKAAAEVSLEAGMTIEHALREALRMLRPKTTTTTQSGAANVGSESTHAA